MTSQKYTRETLAKWLNEIFDESGKVKTSGAHHKCAPEWYAVLCLSKIEGLKRQDNWPSWWTKCYDLVRDLKEHRDFQKMDADQALKFLREIESNLGKFLDMDEFDVSETFTRLWTKYNFGTGVLDKAITAAKEDTADDPFNAYRIYLAIAAHLARLLPDKPIALPNATIAAKLGCLERTVSRLRQRAIQEGRLKMVRNHKFVSGGKGTAALFEYFEALT